VAYNRGDSDGEGTRWSDEDHATMLRLWTDGFSARYIGDLIGRTRNAVLGYIHRRNINKGIRRAPLAPKVRAPKELGSNRIRLSQVPKTKPQPKDGLTVLALPTVQREYTGARPWITRQAFECKFPVSGAGADTFSCCKPTRLLYGYCEEHEARMYAPKKPRVQVPRGV